MKTPDSILMAKHFRLVSVINRFDQLSEEILDLRAALNGCRAPYEFYADSGAAASALSRSAGRLHFLLAQRAGSEAAELLLQLDQVRARTAASRARLNAADAKRHPLSSRQATTPPRRRAMKKQPA